MLTTMQPRVSDRWSPVGRTSKQDYYTRREPPEGAAYSWTHTVDPDGKTRDRLSKAERQQWIADNRELILWLTLRRWGKMLDVGCGPGWAHHAMGWHHDYVGVETAPDALAKLRRDGIPHVQAVEDLPADEFDIVLAYHVIEHMEDPERQMFEMRRVLKKGGHLVIGTPDFHSPCAVRFGDNFRMLHDPTHVSLFTLESMSRFLRDFGFTIEDIQFPFPQRYATTETMARWCDTSQTSPPWPGNWMTFFCRR